jgi:hypothetical protein
MMHALPDINAEWYVCSSNVIDLSDNQDVILAVKKPAYGLDSRFQCKSAHIPQTPGTTAYRVSNTLAYCETIYIHWNYTAWHQIQTRRASPRMEKLARPWRENLLMPRRFGR